MEKFTLLKDSEDIGYWEDIRNKAAISAMQTLLSVRYINVDFKFETCVKDSVKVANMLVHELMNDEAIRQAVTTTSPIGY